MFNELKKVFFSALILFTIFLISDQLVGFVFRKSIDYVSTFWTRKYLKLHHALKNEYPLIFTGDSRMMFSVSPKKINSTLALRSFNLSFDALSLEMQTEFIDILGRQKKPPKTIVMNISSLWLKDDQESHNAFTLLYPLGQNRGLIKEKFPFEAKMNWINSLRYHKVLPDILNGLRKKKNELDYGFRTSYNKEICKGYSGVCKLESANHSKIGLKELLEKESSNITYKHIDKLLKLKKQLNVNIIFITIPFHSLNHIEFAKRNEHITQIITYLNSKNQVIIDLRNKGIENNDNYFRDVSHLNANGANKYTKLLSKSLSEYL